MFLTLLCKELKQMLKSINFYIFLACIIIFYVFQFGKLNGISKPLPNEENYGYKYTTNETTIMENTMANLACDLKEKKFSTYPIGFCKKVALNDVKSVKIYSILQDLTGIAAEDLKSKVTTSSDDDYHVLKVKPNVTFKEFLTDMNKIDSIIGGGSGYSTKSIYRHGVEAKTYEDALKDYESIVKDDNVTRAYAREFADIMVLLISLIPVFFAVIRCMQDKKSECDQVIYSKPCKSSSLILSRYVAQTLMFLFSLILVSIPSLIRSANFALACNAVPDYSAFLKVILGWLMPSVLVSLSVGFFLTTLTNGRLALLVQGLWWFISSLIGTQDLSGDVGLNLVPRFNSWGSYDKFIKIYNGLVINRIFYCAAAVIIIIATIVVYDLKRKGKLNFNGKIF